VGDKPLLGWRKRAIDFAFMGCSFLCQRLNGVSSSKMVDVDVDYSKFLGKDYMKTQKLPTKASTIVSNHTSWLD
jgi:hypothetical protein